MIKLRKIVETLIVESVDTVNTYLDKSFNNPLITSIISKIITKLVSTYPNLYFSTKDTLEPNSITIVNSMVVINLLVDTELLVVDSDGITAKKYDKQSDSYVIIDNISVDNTDPESIDSFVNNVINSCNNI